MVMVREHDAVKILGELFGVRFPIKRSGLDAFPEGNTKHLEPQLLKMNQAIAHQTRTVVEFARRCDKDTATREDPIPIPGEPVVEQRSDSGFTSGGFERGSNYPLGEALGRVIEDLDLEGFLGAKVGKEAALGEVQIVGQSPDGEPGKSNLGREFRGVSEDGSAGCLALSHRTIIARTFVLYNCQRRDAEGYKLFATR